MGKKRSRSAKRREQATEATRSAAAADERADDSDERADDSDERADDSDERADTAPDKRAGAASDVAKDDPLAQFVARVRAVRVSVVPGILVGVVLVLVTAFTIRENASLKARLGPFVEAARRSFPEDNEAVALDKLSKGLPAQGAPVGQSGQRPAAANATVGNSRRISVARRDAIVSRLRQERAENRKAWISFFAKDPEASRFARWLGDLFAEAGWPVETSAWSGSGLKPGMFLFIADESGPAYVNSVVAALEAGGFRATVGTAYRAYAAEMKSKQPEWHGVDMKADQTFALVVGPDDGATAQP